MLLDLSLCIKAIFLGNKQVAIFKKVVSDGAFLIQVLLPRELMLDGCSSALCQSMSLAAMTMRHGCCIHMLCMWDGLLNLNP